MATDNQLQIVVETVVKELARQGLLGEQGFKSLSKADDVDYSGNAVTLPPAEDVYIDHPINLEAVKAMKKTTPARIGIGRAGARPRTTSWLRLLADHALAQDAVFQDVSEEFLKRMDLMAVQSAAETKDQFLTKPELGRRLSEAAVRTIQEKCQKDVQVQVLVVDGLSSSAIEANIPDLLPALMQGLTSAGIKVGKPFFIRHGRVWVQDHVAKVLNAEVVVSLIGERPGLVTADSMSAYIIYRPNEKTVEADRTVISNIHKGGIPPAEAGAHLATLVKEILAAKASGVRFQQMQA